MSLLLRSFSGERLAFKKTYCFYPSAFVFLVFEFFYSYFLILFGNIIITVAVCVSLCETVCCWFKSLPFFSLFLSLFWSFSHTLTRIKFCMSHTQSHTLLSLSLDIDMIILGWRHPSLLFVLIYVYLHQVKKKNKSSACVCIVCVSFILL